MAKATVGRRVTARFSRDESGAWIVDFPDIPGAHTYGRSLRAARRRATEVLELFDFDPAKVDLVEEFELVPSARRAMKDLETSRKELDRALTSSRRQLDRALAELRERMSLSTRDAADLVGISHQRVAQLLQPRRPTSARRPRRKSAAVNR